MPRCAGFVRARFSSGWSPCARRALKGDVLCGGHRDALDPALLGIMELEQAQQFQKQLRSGRRSFPPSARAATASLDGDAGAVVDYERGCSGKGRKATPGRHMTSIRSKQSTANKKSDGRAQNTYFHSLV